MNLDFLPSKVLNAIRSCEIDDVYEIRLKKGYPTKLTCADKRLNLLKDEFGGDIVCEKSDIEYVINYVTENSLYAFNDRIKEGYITTKDGVRIGIAGDCVFSEDKIVTIKNFSSINVRLPRSIDGCSNLVFDKIKENGRILNTLIVSAPGYGKTTLLKDLAKKINDYLCLNVLIIDERGEFEGVGGVNIDKISYSNKRYAFNCALRVMSPDVVITDELVSQEDFDCVNNVCSCGVKIIASCHADCVDKVFIKQGFNSNVFDRYVVLESCGRAGVVKNVFDKELKLI